MKITEYPLATFFDTGDVIIKDGTNGTKKMPATDLMYALFDGVPEMHNQIYRGKSLGSTVTSTQIDSIADGSFHDLWIGDYWTINGINYRIAHFDYYYNMKFNVTSGVGGTPFMKHHALIVPDQSLKDDVIYDTGGDRPLGYTETSLYTTSLPEVRIIFNEAFSDKILTHKLLFTSHADTDGDPDVCNWFDSTVDLMNEFMLWGTTAMSTTQGTPMYTESTLMLKLFEFRPDLRRIESKGSDNNTIWWLRDVADKGKLNSFGFAAVTSGGAPYWNYTMSKGDIRPFCIIGKN